MNYNKWRNNGYMLLSDIIEPELLTQSIHYLNTIYKDKNTASSDFGSDGKLEFPTGKVIDNITLHEKIIGIVKE